MEYQEILNLDIQNIAITNQQIWRSIYEVIHDDYFKLVKLFPGKIIIPNEVKADQKEMALEIGLYAQGVMSRRSELDDKKEKYNTTQYNFQGQLARKNIGSILIMSG